MVDNLGSSVFFSSPSAPSTSGRNSWPASRTLSLCLSLLRHTRSLLLRLLRCTKTTPGATSNLLLSGVAFFLDQTFKTSHKTPAYTCAEEPTSLYWPPGNSLGPRARVVIHTRTHTQSQQAQCVHPLQGPEPFFRTTFFHEISSSIRFRLVFTARIHEITGGGG